MLETLASQLKLVLVTDDQLLGERDPVAVALAAFQGGATMIQLRLKQASDHELLRLARILVERLPIPLVVNDRLDIALSSGAAGVHLGADDLPPILARQVVPKGFLIGASVGNDREISRGAAADYWGIGPLHGSRTKPDAGTALGWSEVARLAALGRRPAVAIGGVQPRDLLRAIQLGLSGVAVVSGILGQQDVTAAAAAYSGQ